MSPVATPLALAHRRWTIDAVGDLSPREQDVLASLAEGRSNGGIATHLFVSERTVETHLHAIMLKLDLLPDPNTNRRVLAAAMWLKNA